MNSNMSWSGTQGFIIAIVPVIGLFMWNWVAGLVWLLGALVFGHVRRPNA